MWSFCFNTMLKIWTEKKIQREDTKGEKMKEGIVIIVMNIIAYNYSSYIYGLISNFPLYPQ